MFKYCEFHVCLGSVFLKRKTTTSFFYALRLVHPKEKLTSRFIEHISFTTYIRNTTNHLLGAN